MALKKEGKVRASSGAAQAARQILDEIISGDLKAGSRLHIQDLVVRTGLGPAPLREGISRLVAGGLVEAIDRRGFKVARIESFDLNDYTAYRLLLEQQAVEQSVSSGDSIWETSLSSALDDIVNFRALPREGPREMLWRYSETHKKFHVALISASPSQRLKANLELLFDQEKFYCHNLLLADEAMANLMSLHSVGEHRSLTEAAIARDADTAVRLLADHQWKVANELRLRLPD